MLNDTTETISSNNTNSVYHVVFLHSKLQKRVEDRYIIDIAKLLKHHGHKVIIYTSDFDPLNCLDEVNVRMKSFKKIYIVNNSIFSR